MPDATQEGNRLLEAANSLFRDDRFKESGEAFAQLAGISGFEAEGHFGRGLSLLNLSDLESANQQFLLALHFDPRHSGASYELGAIAEQENQRDSAIEWYQAALVADPECPPALERLRALLPPDGPQTASLEAGGAEPVPSNAPEVAPQSLDVVPTIPASRGRIFGLGILPLLASVAICVAAVTQTAHQAQLSVVNYTATLASLNTQFSQVESQIQGLERNSTAITEPQRLQEVTAATAKLNGLATQRANMIASLSTAQQQSATGWFGQFKPLYAYILIAGAIGSLLVVISGSRRSRSSR